MLDQSATNVFDAVRISAMIHCMSRPAIARINLDHLRHNYRRLKTRAGQSEIMAVVKANAYGHEQYLVAPTLFEGGVEISVLPMPQRDRSCAPSLAN